MSAVAIFGIMAACFTILIQLPQLIKSLRTRKTRDVALWTCILAVLSTMSWVVYGILRHDAVIIITDTFAFVLAAWILWLKLRHG